MSAIYTIVMLVALCGLVSLGVDIGHVQLAKSELQTAADAACRAAARALPDGVSAAIAAAQSSAAENTCDGSIVALDANADIEFGAWDDSTHSFTRLSGLQQNSADAVRITARRIAARSNAVPLTFARVVGRSTCDIHAVAIAKVTSGSGGGFVGLAGISMMNNAFFASYDSSANPDPTHASASSHGMIGSNGAITAGNNNTVRGDVQLGPSGSLTGGVFVSGSTKNNPAPLPVPDDPDWDPQPNPGGVPQNYTVSSNRTLPGGTYWFTSLAIDGDLRFSGPATVYVNGNIRIDGDLLAYDSRPGNLSVYQLGTGRTFGDSKSNNVSIIATIQAPGSNLAFKNDIVFQGSAVFRTLAFKNNADCYYDEKLGGAGGRRIISLVK